MTVSIVSATQTGPTTYRVEWSSDQPTPTYYIWQDGVLINTTTATSQQFTVAAGESLVLEVLDDAAAQPEAAFPGRLTLTWYAAPGSASYRVERFIDPDWVQQARIPDGGQGSFQYKTGFLADETVHVFRVVPVGTNGNDGDPLEFSVLMVRHPDPPALAFAYDSADQVVTISA